MKTRSLSKRLSSGGFLFCLVVALSTNLAPNGWAVVLFEDEFATAASLNDWTLENMTSSTAEVVEAFGGNMDGYLEVVDQDATSSPLVRRSFTAQDFGYLEIELSGTKWAGSGVVSLYSENGPLFSLSLSTTNTDITALIDGFGTVESGVRVDDAFADPLDLTKESTAFPFSRKVRIVWIQDTFYLYLTGIGGTVYEFLDKASVLPDDRPSEVVISAGYDSATGRTTRIDFVGVYSGLPASGPGSDAPSNTLLFEDDFLSTVSLSEWVIENVDPSSIDVVEGESANMVGYLAIDDNDGTTQPIARHAFEATETGFADFRMSGTKWAGSGVMFLYSESGPLLNISLSTTNDAVEVTLNTYATVPIREDVVFSDPLDAALESSSFPFGRDFRVEWSDGLLQIYMVGMNGAVYRHTDKPFTLEGEQPSAVGFSAGYDSATGRSGFVDFVRLYSGIPNSGLGTSVAGLPFVEDFGTPEALDSFALPATDDHTIAIRDLVERGMDGFLYMEDLNSATRPSIDLNFVPAPSGHLKTRFVVEGPNPDVLTLGAGSDPMYRIGMAITDDEIRVHLNHEAEPVLTEALASGETTGSTAARALTLVWSETDRADLYWETAGGAVIYVPAVPAMTSGTVDRLGISAGTDASTGGIIRMDNIQVDAGRPARGVGAIDPSLPYQADFTRSLDLEGWTVSGTIEMAVDELGLLTGALVLADEDGDEVTRLARNFTPVDYGMITLGFLTGPGAQEILRIESDSGPLYTVAAQVDASGYGLRINGEETPSLVGAFARGESVASHGTRRLLVKWDGPNATFTLGSEAGVEVTRGDVPALAAGNPGSIELRAGAVDSVGLELIVNSIEIQRASRVWDSYVAAWKAGEDLPLANYANAGYDYGRSGIPEVHELGLPFFDVTDYGAVPDDEHSDRAAIVSTIAAAEIAGGGVVFFPPGVFLVNEVSGLTTSQQIRIRKSNIVLKGSGSGVGGTTLFMRKHLLPTDLDKAWSTPALFVFEGETDPWRSMGQTAEPTRMGSYEVVLEDASELKIGDTIRIYHRERGWNDDFLKGQPIRSDWEQIQSDGVFIREYNRVAAIEGNLVKLRAPITGSFPAGLSVHTQLFNHHVGIEDLQFQGNFHEEFDHHGGHWDEATMKAKYGTRQLYAAYMDGAYSAFVFNGVEDSWCRRVRFTDVNVGATFRFTTSCSILETTFDGNAGHSTLAFNYGSHNLIGSSQDITPLGYLNGHHGPTMANGECGSVVWRWTTSTASAFDFHASFPRANLVDAYVGWGWDGSGGSNLNLPNILDETTFWNQTVNGPIGSTLDFWDLGSTYSGTLRAVLPNFVGLQAAYPVTPVLESMGRAESLDGLVYPLSLYEAQMELEYGGLPEWIARTQARFEDQKELNQEMDPAGVAQYRLDLTVPEGGRLVTDLANGDHRYLTIGKARLEVEDGYTFLGWWGDINTDSPDSVFTMTQDIRATAIIVPSSHPHLNDPSSLANLSMRAQAGTGEGVLITGFVIAGTGSKTLLVRAVGPTIGAEPFNVPDTLAEPTMGIYHGETILGEFSAWETFGDQDLLASSSALVGTFPLALGSADSAAVQLFEPGAYTVHVSGADAQTGVALVELYDTTGQGSDAELVNISSRVVVGDDGAVAIPGVVITGLKPKQVLIRAVGPELGAFGVSGFLSDPKMELYTGNDWLGSNDNWNQFSDQIELEEATIRAGAFPLVRGSRDAAGVYTLAPGSYTVVVSGVGGATGVALVEVYSLD